LLDFPFKKRNGEEVELLGTPLSSYKLNKKEKRGKRAVSPRPNFV
jgi:hypothetical protein